MQTTPVRWTTADLELLAGDSRSETLRERRNRYEIIDGKLFVTKASNWNHQSSCGKIVTDLNNWSDETGLGKAA